MICQDASYYVRSTNDLQQRIQDHANGKGSAYTKGTKPVILAWYESHPDREAAQSRERQLKNWSRIKKNHLARGDNPAFQFGVRPWFRLH